MHDRIVGSSSFSGKIITAKTCQDLIHIYIILQLQELQSYIVFQHDYAFLRKNASGRELLNEVFPNRWLSRNVYSMIL